MSVIVLCRRVATNVFSRPKIGDAGAALIGASLAIMTAIPHAKAAVSATQKSEEVSSFFGVERPVVPQQQAPEPIRGRHHRRPYARHAVSAERRNAEPSAVETMPSSGSSSVLAEAKRYLGRGNVTGSHRAWCADFTNMVLRRTGHRSSNSGMVDSLLSVGSRVSHPAPGDIVVMRSHVTIFAGYGGRGFYGLGGNQHSRVAMSNFPLRSVVAFVHPN